MDGIELMVLEHEHIKSMLAVVRKACYVMYKNKSIDYEDFYSIIDFIRNYADKHHHGKEEKFLFTAMAAEIGGPAEKIVKIGMMTEHDLGRLYINDLEEAIKQYKSGNDEAAIDIISNAISYTHLLYRHIDKENTVVYTYAKRELSKDTMARIDALCETFEDDSKKAGIQQKYLSLLEALQAKYSSI